MATYTVTTAKHATLTANTVDTVTLSGQPSNRPQSVEVTNRGSDVLYFTVDGTTPTVAGDDTYIVLAGSALRVDGSATVKLVSASPVGYSVTVA